MKGTRVCYDNALHVCHGMKSMRRLVVLAERVARHVAESIRGGRQRQGPGQSQNPCGNGRPGSRTSNKGSPTRSCKCSGNLNLSRRLMIHRLHLLMLLIADFSSAEELCIQLRRFL